ncbi:unnamed protein product, partial [Iphiclides podalirius]
MDRILAIEIEQGDREIVKLVPCEWPNFRQCQIVTGGAVQRHGIRDTVGRPECGVAKLPPRRKSRLGASGRNNLDCAGVAAERSAIFITVAELIQLTFSTIA